ncbi:pseudoazurin [Sphingomonas sp. SUN019]|uniref:pseudoazurin n=1 Tax=Sphingomonas sp. SUN019 TaxID=2937788 RepID=UPI0021643764|nr:pseudoazurin [Sphingomonas sp. SUN019]UVO49285.1 pseudoazurin [Sphingomonas sp. SUN019]
MKCIAYSLVGVALSIAAPAMAKDVVVQMKNQGAGGAMVFEPAFVKADVGDTIRFVPTDKSHNAETIPNMLPTGVAPTVGGMNKEFVLSVTKPGVYGIKCKPHYSMGMIALVQVGKGPSANLGAARAVKLPPFAAKRMTPMLAQAK